MIIQEINSNFQYFENEWPVEQQRCVKALNLAKEKFLNNYINITKIQAWRILVIEKKMCEDSQGFFFEAQNDLLTSHCLARSGAFRQALKSLRSFIENIFFSLYYSEHPVELIKWKKSQHRLGFQELYTYFATHPQLENFSEQKNGLSTIKEEYSTLSKAVHGSAMSFRMTKNLTDIKIWSDDVSEAGQWSTREKQTIQSINLFLIHFFCEELKGAKLLPLRKVLGINLSTDKINYFKENLSINIIKNNSYNQ